MADLKKLIGNALNKAKGTKPSDDGYATRKAFDIINENKVKSARPGLNTNVPASTKTTKPVPAQKAQLQRDKEQAKFGSTTYSSEKGYSPKRKEEQKSEMKSGLVSGIQKMKSAFQPKNKRTI
tara:strand:+ start:237 stop:605 length:369 start_codon:yes stop_codon:yes gene_type:complete